MMKKLVVLLAVGLAWPAAACQRANPDVARWERQAEDVTIIRDDWGIAHVFGRTDADAVFGMVYAQAEDDFNRVETNYLVSLGRLAEAEGDAGLYQDLRARLFLDHDQLKQDYETSPAWLKALMDAFADGLNYYLYTHPEVTPRAITRFEPWMALSFSEGSIGGDIERANLRQIEAFYGGTEPGDPPPADQPAEPSGSNGIAVAASNTSSGHALLLINPHTSFYFRSELQMTSEEGLNAYGAVTWGQFFVYQGFNERAGWMHTSSGVDAIDEYLETVEQRDGTWVYRHGDEWRPVEARSITLSYRTDSGMATRTFTGYRTEHGPVVGEADGRWRTMALMNEPIKALTQSYTRTKATSYETFRETMELHTNSSNNTIYADADGNIAYFHGNYIPKRDIAFDWTQPVDGSDPATDYQGLLALDETPNLLNPATGWLYNANDWPWEAAGPDSPVRTDFPAYVENGGPSARGRHAVLVLEGRTDFTLDGLLAAAYDSYLTWFEKPLPALVRAWDALPAGDARRAALAEQVALLRDWNLRWAADSIPTALAVFWGTEVQRQARGSARQAGLSVEDYLATRAPVDELLGALTAASDRLTEDFGSWKTPWGEINRFQRLNDDITPSFDDSQPSIPVPFTSASWGSLASYGARAYPNTRKWYGTSGNSFVAVVEFGDTVRALAVTAGGESGDPASPHFDDQAERYASGNLREVYFYRDQLQGHTEREYHPGR